MLHEDQQLLSLIDAIYAAAVDVNLWPSLCERLIAIAVDQAAPVRPLGSDGVLKLPAFNSVHFDSRLIREYLDLTSPAGGAPSAFLDRHVKRALEIGFRLATLGSFQQATADILDRTPLAILFLDDCGRLVLANRAARRIAAASEGLRISSAGLGLSNGADDRRLRRFVAAALDSRSDIADRPGGALWAFRPSGRRPFSILVSPLSRGAFAMTSVRPAVCIVIADPDNDEALPVDDLRALYGLTSAEARLAARLAAGEALKSAAAALGIGYTTARTQLAAIFRKTGTKRQGDLLRLMLTVVPILPS